MSDATPAQTPDERLAAASEEFDAVNRALPNGMQPFQMPPWTDLTAAVNGAMALLVEKGIATEDECLDAKKVALAELVENMTGQAREIKKQFTGLVIAGPGQQV